MDELKDNNSIENNIGLKQLRAQREEITKRWEKLGLLDGLDGNVKVDCAKLFEGQLSWIMSDASKTANDLWNDPKFIIKRIEEQENYLKELVEKFFTDGITTDRYEKLKSSALYQLEKFQKQKNYLLR